MNNNILFYGKLRRRREYINNLQQSGLEYIKWDKWFSRCSNNNALVPFLNSKKRYSDIWLFVLIEEMVIYYGLTCQSIDHAGRKYPFLIYTQNEKTQETNREVIHRNITYMVSRNQKFSDIISLGDFTEEQYEYFSSSENINYYLDEYNEVLEKIINDIMFNIKNNLPVSLWLNMNNLKYVEHNNAFTCSLYNKIYG